MDAKLEQMIKERIEIANKRYGNKVPIVFNELVLDSSSLCGYITKNVSFGPLELELKSVEDGACGKNTTYGHYHNVNFKGQCVLSFYRGRSGMVDVRSYIPGEWEAELEGAYLLAKRRYDDREKAKEDARLHKQEVEDAELLRRFGIDPKNNM